LQQDGAAEVDAATAGEYVVADAVAGMVRVGPDFDVGLGKLHAHLHRSSGSNGVFHIHWQAQLAGLCRHVFEQQVHLALGAQIIYARFVAFAIGRGLSSAAFTTGSGTRYLLALANLPRQWLADWARLGRLPAGFLLDHRCDGTEVIGPVRNFQRGKAEMMSLFQPWRSAICGGSRRSSMLRP
jgi:hypothetical protein